MNSRKLLKWRKGPLPNPSHPCVCCIDMAARAPCGAGRDRHHATAAASVGRSIVAILRDAIPNSPNYSPNESAATSLRGAPMPLADFALTILICHSPVDEFKHAGRKEAIRATWGSARQRVGGWKVHSYFVEPKPPVEAAEPARDELFAPDGLAPTEQFVWAVRAIHAVSGGHPRHWFFRAETITFVRVPMLCALLERQSRSSGEGAPDADPRRGPRPLFVGRVLRTDAPPAGETFLSGGAGCARAHSPHRAPAPAATRALVAQVRAQQRSRRRAPARVGHVMGRARPHGQVARHRHRHRPRARPRDRGRPPDIRSRSGIGPRLPPPVHARADGRRGL